MISNLRPLAVIVSIMVAIEAAITPIILIWAKVDLYSLQVIVGPIATEVDYGAMIFRFLTVIVFSVWIYRAGANLLAAGFDDLEFTPGSRIWWFAIPIASLFKPFQGMRELWNASHGSTHYDANSGLIPTWWALWLASTVANAIVRGTRTAGTDTPISYGAATIDAALAVAAIVMVLEISKAQAKNLSHEGLDELFA